MTLHELPKLKKPEMERLFRKSKRRSQVFFGFTVFLTACCLWLYLFSGNEVLSKALFICFCIALGFWALVAVGQILLFRLLSIPLAAYKGSNLGGHSISGVQTMLDQSIGKHAGKELPTVYVLQLDIVNAFAVNIYLFNSFRAFNAIYISEKCFQCLSKEELEALLLHELGHFNTYSYDETKFMNIGNILFMVMPFAFVVLAPGIIVKVVFVIVTLLSIIGLYMLIRSRQMYDTHVLEYLSDLYAAERVGSLATINMLLTVAQQNVTTEEKTKKKILKKVLLPVKRTMVDWSMFDTHIVNGKIEAEEYHRLVRALQGAEHPQLVADTLTDHNTKSHPSLTNRILFLHQNLGFAGTAQ
jgi:Zn-dependent protease with chaperone function